MNSVYLIAYDIHEQQYDYAALKSAIMSYGDYQHPMEAVWFVCVPGSVTADDISTRLHGLLQSPHDHILVMQVPPNVYCRGWMQKTMWRWLRKRLKATTDSTDHTDLSSHTNHHKLHHKLFIN